MKHRFLSVAVWLTALLASPVAALAQSDQDNKYDARLYGFSPNVALNDSSTALIWIAFIVLAFITLVVMFKNAKRTHLD